MASVNSSSTVTIDRGYFDTLLRRAKFNTEPFEKNNNHEIPPMPAVSISQAEFDRLQSIARQYENLRRNLLRGGVGAETVDLLSMDDASIQENKTQPASAAAAADAADATDDGGVPLKPRHTRNGFFDRSTPASNGNGGHGGQQHGARGGHYHSEQPAWGDVDPEEEDVSVDGDAPVGASYNVKPQVQRPQFDRQCTRTIQLVNLADGTTHADITGAVRGGMLLDVFLRGNERTATVSFLLATDARGFYDHVRKYDLYIKNKRVDIRWSDRQFILPGHVAGKVATGATRNLVLRRCDSRHTEESIREDLDHIHNLIVVKVEFSDGDCHINTNSVHNAIYARMCMMSRFKYKGTKIEWDADECAQPWGRIPHPKARKEAPAPRKPSATMANRFQLLNVDGSDEDEITATFQSKKSVGIAA